ncbi:MAG: hypothetical protein A3H60_02850 [Candidatus Zambryskibacteria bacterium RIFCSPLOWO2_02_FULL_44_12b]|uniref:Major facilitator superfamily (MFS) profile domain-containing protein n=1 Tax=Candidatus Zambryskibacteria bacterium RIFCSPLOWO2_02_FULL_44_12b TaxID=1802772 RepID=A0A1G2UKR4_9BACT|nr:MAG: hypothetical protein A3H60_02850 [Candidatus Zambryskibacteria bacterium RIFCSPLOWO2_02_FULL_44_12b]
MMRFGSIFVSTLFLSIHYGAILYVNSSLLGSFFEPNVVSMLFLAGAVGNIILFLFAPQLIEMFGKRLLLLILLCLSLLSTLGLAFASTVSVIVFSFLAYSSFIFVIYYYLDIVLEELSTDTKTGEIRGIYLTIINIGIALGPLVTATLVEGPTLRPIYIAAALLLLPSILLALLSFKSKTPKWHGLHRYHSLLPFNLWWRTKGLRHATLAKLVLESFFGLMIIYVPVYLHSVIGFEWETLGIMFFIMLLPFVIFQWPVGELADRFIGEKELMIIGFLIMGAATFSMPYLGPVVILWTAILFLSRVGASLIEVTTESYFFKHVRAEDTRLISIFRLARPAGFIVGAVVGSLTLNLFSFEKIFFVLVVIIFFGLRESLSIRDTR